MLSFNGPADTRISDAPPCTSTTYAAKNPTTNTLLRLHSGCTNQYLTPLMPTSHFPQTFIFEWHRNCKLFLSSIPDEAGHNQPLYHILFRHSLLHSEPDVELHSNTSTRLCPNTPPLCSANFKDGGLLSSSALNLMTGSETVPVKASTGLKMSHTFSAKVSPSGATEDFEWQRSKRKEFAHFIPVNGVTVGMKLVRCSTGQIVAVFARNGFRLGTMGKMGFLGAGMDGGLGEDWELFAVTSLLAIMERRRRNARNQPSYDRGYWRH